MRRLLQALLILLVLSTAAYAHVPFLEHKDFGHKNPFTPELPHQSIAVYAWLETAGDVDYYVFRLHKKTTFFAEVLVPVFEQYKEFRPCFALIGKGLPALTEALPVKPHEGYGAVMVVDDVRKPREKFYERFGGKSYYRGPRLERMLEPGVYAVVYWDPRRRKGDYVAVLGKKEIWRPKDIVRAIKVTPKIRKGKELHLKETKEPGPAPSRPAATPSSR